LGDGAGGFGARREHALSGLPVAVALGDLDGDGHADLVVATHAPAALAVLLGAADGSLRLATESSTPFDPSAVALGDYNADGQLDVAVAEPAASTIRIWRGDGRGGFSGFTTLATATAPSALAVADMDGDGRPDLVCASHDDRTLQVFLDITPRVTALRLVPPSPNPATQFSVLRFTLGARAPVRVEIHDVTGRLVRRLLPERVFPPGFHALVWDGLTDHGDHARSGLYFVRVRAGGAEEKARIVLTR
jgi:hypothetical protein